MSEIVNQLEKEIQYAKNSKSIRLLYQAHGAIGMAFNLGAISKTEFFDLDHKCICDGINNPEIFNKAVD